MVSNVVFLWCVYVCEGVSAYVFFTLFLYFCLFLFYLAFFWPVFFSNERGKEGMELDGWGGREHLAGDEGLILTIRIYCIKN